MTEILDIFGVDWKLLLVQAFNFGLVLLVLWYFLYRPVLTMLKKRQAVIADGVRKAELAESELKEVAGQKEAILTDATKEASTILERSKERAEMREAATLKEAQDRADRMMAEAQERAAQEHRQVMQSAQEEVARMVVLGAEKVLRNSK